MRNLVRVLSLCALAAGTAFAGEPADAGFPGYEALRESARSLWKADNAAGGAYVVLVPPGSPLRPAAAKLAGYRKGEILEYTPDAPEKCLPELIAKRARYAAIFAEPKDMDVNLLRKFIVISTLLDADPFCDVAIGFITASSPKKVSEFVDRILAASRNGLTDYSVLVSASNISARYDTSFLPGMKGESWYIKEGDTEYAREALAQLGRAGFVHLGACSDPEGIWLFDDQRNMDPAKHWPYDAAKVGQDPKGEMPRITAEYFKGLKLNNAVVWTHACHLGAVGRVYVEGDIVSTFGATEKLEVYTIPEGRSVALAIIDAGVSAYICPIGANFGAQSSLERDIASETGVPLGDVLRRGYHDVVMDTNGHPEQIGVFVAGKPNHWNPDGFTNNNSPQHRCLYGDPMFAPFEKRKSPASVEVTADEKEDGIRVSFKLTASGFDVGRTWYGNRGGEEEGRGRFYEEVPLKQNIEQAYIEEIRTSDADGKPFEVSSQEILVERIDGRTVLHIQVVSADLTDFEYGGGASAKVSVLAKAGATAEVFVKFGPAPAGGVKQKGGGVRPVDPPKPAAKPGEPAWLPAPPEETPENAARLKGLLAEHRKLKSPSEIAARGQVVLDIGQLRTLPALRVLLDFLADEKDSYVRMLLVSAIAGVDGRDAATALLNALASEQDAAMRNNLRTAIVHSLGTKAAAEALRQGLQHRAPVARAAAAAALGRIGWVDTVPALVAATKDVDLAARLAAIEALKVFIVAEAVDCLLRLAAGDDDGALTALWALEESGNDDPRILDLARGILASGKSASLRMQAAHLAGVRRDASVLKSLLKMLSDRDVRLRATAVEALANIRHRDAVEPLIERLDSEEGRLAADVALALARITGVSFGRDSKRWREWWKTHKEGFQPPPEKPDSGATREGMTEVAYHDIPVVSQRIIFVLDISASMAEAMTTANVPSGPEGGPAGNTRLDLCKWELSKTIRKLPKDVRFNIVTFGSEVTAWKSALTPALPAARADALSFVEKLTPTGATNLHGALQRAFQDRDADTFYVLSDGQPTDGAITNSSELLAWVRRTNASRAVVIHTISAGELTAVTDNLLEKIAKENRGRSVVLK